MSDLLNQASLVMVPSGYKEDTVYSVVPSDGSGDLSFTRASNGTRVNSAGLVEEVPWNLLLNTNTLSSYDLQGGTLTSGFTAPDGSSTAFKYVPPNTAFGLWATLNLPIMSTGTGATLQIYVKSVSGSNVTFSLGSGYSSAGASTKTATSQWQLFTVSFAFSDGGSMYVSSISDATNGIYVWHPQINAGLTAKPYFPTTDRLNVPRLTYQNGGGGCPSLLLEKQSTNLLTYSEQFDNANWTKIDITITANATTSPDGTQNANRLYETSTNSQHGFFQYKNAVSSGTNYAVSCYVKKGNRSYCGLQFWYDVNTGVIAFFNLDNGTLVYEFAEGSGYSISNSKIESVGNGWYRLSAIVQIGITEAYSGLVMASTQWSTGTGYDNHYTGDSSKYIDVYGYQLEASSYPTSYIPTTSSSATRVADLGANDVFGSTYTLDADFCLFQDFECFDFGNGQVFWSGGNYGTGGDYRSYMIAYSTGNIVLFGVNEVATAQLSAFIFSTNTRYKVAVRRVGSTINWFVNGTKYSNASGTTTTTVKIRSISGASLGGQSTMKLNEAIIFEDKTLTDDDCISLTTI